MAEWRVQPSFDLTPFIIDEDETRFQLGWASDKFITVRVYNNEVRIHISRFVYDSIKGWIPTKTGIELSPIEVQEFAQYLPHLGQAFHLAEQKLKEQSKPKMEERNSIPMDISRPEPMDAIEEFEVLLLNKHCRKLIDEIKSMKRTSNCRKCKAHNKGFFIYISHHDATCLLDLTWKEGVEHCFDTAYENVKLEPLFDEVKKELQIKHSYVNRTMLNVLANTIQSSSSNKRRDIKNRVLEFEHTKIFYK